MEIKDRVLNNEQVQVALTATFGDGHMRMTPNRASYGTNCKMREYIEFKNKLLGNLSSDVKRVDKNGFSQTYIHTLISKSHPEFKLIHSMSLNEKLNLLDDLGIALWMYDDGSIHKKHHFYNINTQSFNEEDNGIISKFLNDRLGIYSRVMTERKKDGRVFYYIFVPPCGGAYKLSELMSKYPIEEYSYKLYPEGKLNDLKCLHEFSDKFNKPGTESHFKMTTSNRLRFSGYKKKNPLITVEEFLEDYVTRPLQ